MRLRSALGAGLVAVAVVAAVAVLRTPSVPPAGPSDSPAAAVPVVDARSRQLTADFRVAALLPVAVRFADDPGTPPGFVFRRFADVEAGHVLVRYTAAGLLVRSADRGVLDRVLVNVWRADGHIIDAAVQARCDPAPIYLGPSCMQGSLPNGELAKVVRNSAFAQAMASDATTGSPSGLQTELQVGYPNGTLLTVSLDSLAGAGIPLDDAAMLRLAAALGINASR
ncbi:MAG TPA: hypothetical protein VGL06_17465 [Pseudonocardiaceae bacterium]